MSAFGYHLQSSSQSCTCLLPDKEGLTATEILAWPSRSSMTIDCNSQRAHDTRTGNNSPSKQTCAGHDSSINPSKHGKLESAGKIEMSKLSSKSPGLNESNAHAQYNRMLIYRMPYHAVACFATEIPPLADLSQICHRLHFSSPSSSMPYHITNPNKPHTTTPGTKRTSHILHSLTRTTQSTSYSSILHPLTSSSTTKRHVENVILSYNSRPAARAFLCQGPRPPAKASARECQKPVT